MKVPYDELTLPLPGLLGDVRQRPRLVLPSEVVMRIPSYRHACRLAWRLRFPRITQQTLAAVVPGLYQSHVSEYFSALASSRRGQPKRELPAKYVGAVERELGNVVVTQWLVHNGRGTLLEEMQADRVQIEQRTAQRKAA